MWSASCMSRALFALLCWNLSAIYLYCTEATYVAPGPTVNIDSVNRTDFCTRAVGLLSGMYNVSTVMKGAVVTVALQYDISPVYYVISNDTGVVSGGLMYTLQQQIASLGGFSFEYYMVDDPNGKSSTSYMLQTLDHFDMLGVYYTDTLSRRSAGIGFTEELVDASLVLISMSKPDFMGSLWNFLLPFAPELWLWIAILIVFNSLLFYVLENRNADDKVVTIFEGVYAMWGTFTGGGGPEPSKQSTKLLNMGYFFFMMITLATYTATLTSALIINDKLLLQSINEAESSGADVCVLYGSSAQSVLTASYPSINLVTDKTIKSADDIDLLFARLRDGDCVGAVVSMIDWQTQSVKSYSNPECNLELVDTFRPFSGSMPYLVDFTNYCTSLVEIAISSIIVGMKADGTLDSMIDQYLTQDWSDVTCTSADSSSSSATSQLGPADLAGIFVVYCIFLGWSTIRLIYEQFIKVFKGGLPRSDLNDDDSKLTRIDYLQKVGRLRRKGTVRLLISAVHGLPRDYLNRVVYVKTWSTSSSVKTLVRCCSCVLEDEELRGSSKVSALFDGCHCDIPVDNMEEEALHIQIVVGEESLGSPSSGSSGSASISLKLLGLITIPCVDIVSNKRMGTVLQLRQPSSKLLLGHLMTLNSVLLQPHKPPPSRAKSVPSTLALETLDWNESFEAFIYPINVMFEFDSII